MEKKLETSYISLIVKIVVPVEHREIRTEIFTGL